MGRSTWIAKLLQEAVELALDQCDVGFLDDTVLNRHLEFASDRRALSEDDESTCLTV